MRYPSQDDIYLFRTGGARRAYEIFGCHYIEEDNVHRFGVWAPNANYVSVVGDFNDWDEGANPMEMHDGIHFAFISGLKNADNYKYFIEGADGSRVLKAAPYAVHSELRPATASKVWELDGYEWNDAKFMKARESNTTESKMAIYELDLSSWKKPAHYECASLAEITDELVDYVADMGFTHVELLPVTEFPYDDSWGYQVTGYYAFTSRYGTPQEFMALVDKFHGKGIGVLMDWVPAHFTKDEHGLRRFDGTCLYEHEHPLQGEQPAWGTLIFNYGRPEVQSFLISSAMFFMDKFHIDGIRCDAISSMLYLNYGKDEYIPNKFGGSHNLDAIDFLRALNHAVLSTYKGTYMIAEESSAFPLVTMPPDMGGLGFSLKWNMGYMNDTLRYFSMDTFYRSYNHNLLTFSMYYAFSENYILPYSHDEVVHGKCSMISKMPGYYDDKFANLRALYGFMYAHPGKKLLFMGNEFAQFSEWYNRRELDWMLLEYPRHAEMREYVKKLNSLYTKRKPLHEIDNSWDGFTWLSVDDADVSCVSFMRKSKDGKCIIAAFNFTPVMRDNYRIGIPFKGRARLILASNDEQYGGTGGHSKMTMYDEPGPCGQPHHARFDLPGLSAVYYEFVPLKKD